MKVSAPFLMLLLLIPLTGCARKSAQKVPSNSSPKEISRERAIEIARSQVKFQPKSIKAEKAVENGRPVWRVTFRGEPIGPASAMGEVMIVSIDRLTGEIVSIAQSSWRAIEMRKTIAGFRDAIMQTLYCTHVHKE